MGTGNVSALKIMINACRITGRACSGAIRFFLLAAIIMGAVFAYGCTGVSGSKSSGEKIKVLVLSGQHSIELSGHDGSDHARIVKKSAESASVDGSTKKLPLIFVPQKELLYVNGRPYRGTIKIISDNDGLSVVDILPIESYLVGVINHEISSKWHIEAVKAQAIVARTYAYVRMKNNSGAAYHIEGTVAGQVYKGTSSEDEAAQKAVRSTAGIILAYKDKPVMAVYHSNAGGRTEAAKEIWNTDYEYLRSVKSPYDKTQPGYEWTYSITSAELKTALKRIGRKGGVPVKLSVEETMPSGRVKTVLVKTDDSEKYTITGEDLRKAIGQTIIKSTLFEIDRSGGKFFFTGRGYGHGVGMSQWGAKGMAEDGYSYKEILYHYYPGTDLARAW